MHPLTTTFDAGRALLARNPSVHTFADPDISTEAKLAVIPAMAFWVLAFGDAMALLRKTAGDTALGGILRQHAEEDSEHWRWFLRDIQLLAARGIGAGTVQEALVQQWGSETAAVRSCAWTLHHLLRAHRDPVVRLGLLEACEHGFDAFMGSIRPVVQAWPDYAQLAYLGAVHDHAEASHALHDLEDPFVGVAWESRDIAAVRQAVTEMYAALDGLHTSYDQAIIRAHHARS